MNGKRPEIDQEKQEFKPVIGPMNVRVMSMAFLLQTQDTPVIWRGPMKMGAIRQFLSEAQWGALDYMIFDLPPGTSDETLDILQLIDDAGIVVVTTPQDVALLDSRKTVNMSKQMNDGPLKKYNNDMEAFKAGYNKKEPEKPVLREFLGIVENMSGFKVKCPDCNKFIDVDVFGSGGGEKAAKEMNVPFLGLLWKFQ